MSHAEAPARTPKQNRAPRRTVIQNVAAHYEKEKSTPLDKINIAECERKLKTSITALEEFEIYQAEVIAENESGGAEAEIQKEKSYLQETQDLVNNCHITFEAMTKGRMFLKNATRLRKDLETALPRIVPPLTKGTTERAEKLGDRVRDTHSLQMDLSTEYKTQTASLWAECEKLNDTIENKLYDEPGTAASPSTTRGGTKDSDEIHRLPRIDFPTFDGDPMNWLDFRKEFEASIARASYLSDMDKIYYLKRAVKGSSAEAMLRSPPGSTTQYNDLMELLHNNFDMKREVYQTLIQNMISYKMNGNTRADYHQLKLMIHKTVNAFQMTEQFDGETMLVAIMERSFTDKARTAWSRKTIKEKKVPSLTMLQEFLTEEESVAPKTDSTTTFKPKFQKSNQTYPSASSFQKQHGNKSYSKKDESCPICKEEAHPLYICTVFKELSVNDRHDAIQKVKGCTNCLATYHQLDGCLSDRICKVCGERHHTYLHRNIKSKKEDKTDATVAVTRSVGTQARFLLGRARLQTRTRSLEARIFFDSGTEVPVITERMANKLCAPTLPGTATLSGADNLSSSETRRIVQVSLDLGSGEEYIDLDAVVVPHIINQAPTERLHINFNDPIFKDVQLSDHSFNIPGPVDIMVGLDVYDNIIQEGVRKSSIQAITLYKSSIGWLASFNRVPHVIKARVFTTTAQVADARADDMLSRFWTQESEALEEKPYSRNDQLALEHFQTTHERLPSGRYQVSLPRNPDGPILGRSKEQAIKRYLANEASLKKKGQWPAFKEVIEEYFSLSHAETIPSNEPPPPTSLSYHLPMHGIIKQNSTTTKLRAVFDASARTSSGASLNSTLLQGPNLYPLLPEVIMNFRTYAVAMTSDITKMFREIALEPAEKDYHRFIWRDKTGLLTSCRMTRLTFGVASSPFLATQVLRQLAEDFESRFPLAAAVVRDHFYVDDCLTGAATVQDAITLRQQLNQLLQEAGMTLRKWRTNSPTVLQSIPNELQELSDPALTISAPANCQKTLGIHWSTEADTLHIATPTLQQSESTTKRELASQLARTYDVMGWFTPALLIPKAMMQTLWKADTKWDEKIANDIHLKWQEWKKQLPLLTNKAIPRPYHLPEKTIFNIQIHGFCDASQTAYACVVYLRTCYTDTTTSVAIVLAKSRLAPLNTVSIPRLELCGARLLASVITSVRNILKLPSDHCHAWSDSMIVLAWLHKTPGTLETYVANRTAQIITALPAKHWHYVPTTENPADIASRGIFPDELIDHPLWWSGPQWLKQDPALWPARTDYLSKNNMPEMKRASIAALVCTTTTSTPFIQSLISRTTTWKTLRRTMAWVLRAIQKFKHPNNRTRPAREPLTTDELNTADLTIFRLEQQQFYDTILSALRNNTRPPTADHLSSLNPYIDSDGLLRVGGRLLHADVANTQKHPLILHKKAATLRLMITDMHQRAFHLGPSGLMGLMAGRYYICGARSAIRKVTSNCIPCKKVEARAARQLMGQLPRARVSPNDTFREVGVDFAGPVHTKRGHTRRPVYIKSYIAVFVCTASKSIHLEPVETLSTASFLETLSRFIARRGKPHTIHCDNGSNFRGAHVELDQLYQMIKTDPFRDQVMEFLADQCIRWEHIPAYAPHFGGLWESQVKCVKRLLQKTFGLTVFTIVGLFNVLAGIESALNSRPLVPLETTPEDVKEAITPGHILIGRPLMALPEGEMSRKLKYASQYRYTRERIQYFWNNWKGEYLKSLQRRHKWKHPDKNIRVNDIILMKDKEWGLNHWPMGRVTEVFPGPDGLVRAVNVKSAGTTYRRPIHKLVVLYHDSSDNEEEEEPDATDDHPGSPGGRMFTPEPERTAQLD